MTSVRLREVKNKNKNKCLKVVAVTYKRWLLTRGSNYIDLTGDILVFWKSGSSREAKGRSVMWGAVHKKNEGCLCLAVTV